MIELYPFPYVINTAKQIMLYFYFPNQYEYDSVLLPEGFTDVIGIVQVFESISDLSSILSWGSGFVFYNSLETLFLEILWANYTAKRYFGNIPSTVLLATVGLLTIFQFLTLKIGEWVW